LAFWFAAMANSYCGLCAVDRGDADSSFVTCFGWYYNALLGSVSIDIQQCIGLAANVHNGCALQKTLSNSLLRS